MPFFFTVGVLNLKTYLYYVACQSSCINFVMFQKIFFVFIRLKQVIIITIGQISSILVDPLRPKSRVQCHLSSTRAAPNRRQPATASCILEPLCRENCICILYVWVCRLFVSQRGATRGPDAPATDARST